MNAKHYSTNALILHDISHISINCHLGDILQTHRNLCSNVM